MCSKNMNNDSVFIKTEIRNEWSMKFLKLSFFGIQNMYSSEFSVG